MAEINDTGAYFRAMVRNLDKNDYRANDNFFNHISSVGDENDICAAQSKEKKYETCHVEDALTETGIENWLLFMENEWLHRAITQMKARDIQCLYLCFVLRYSNIEVAERFGSTANAVAKWKKRLFGTVKKYFPI